MGFWKKLRKGITSPFKVAGGAIATVGTSVAFVATAGQCKAVRKSVKHTAKFTAKEFMKSDIRHVGEMAGMAMATAGTCVAVVATAGKVKAVSKAVVKTAKATKKSYQKTSPVVDVAAIAAAAYICVPIAAKAAAPIVAAPIVHSQSQLPQYSKAKVYEEPITQPTQAQGVPCPANSSPGPRTLIGQQHNLFGDGTSNDPWSLEANY